MRERKTYAAFSLCLAVWKCKTEEGGKKQGKNGRAGIGNSEQAPFFPLHSRMQSCEVGIILGASVVLCPRALHREGLIEAIVPARLEETDNLIWTSGEEERAHAQTKKCLFSRAFLSFLQCASGACM